MIKEMLAERNLPEIPENREEIKEILQREIYGYMPGKPEKVAFEIIGNAESRFPSRASLQQMKCTFTYNGKQGEFLFKTAIHTDGKKRPFFVHINFRSDVPDLYQPTEEILDNGFDVLSFGYKDVTSDDGDFSTGIAPLFVNSNDRADTECGKIIMWAWAVSRVLDYAETVSCLDMDNAAVVGHSRLGKTALVTGMFDERVKYAISNNSGCSGAALARETTGETVADITKNFPFWFCPNYKKYVGKHEEMPFDQHYLLASLAPRFAYVASSSLDAWADPANEYLCCHAASDYFEKKGVKGFTASDRLPENGDSFHEGNIGYHIKDGAHFLSRYDWNEYMNFIKKKVKNESN